jgi:hypothetical protein
MVPIALFILFLKFAHNARANMPDYDRIFPAQTTNIY